MYVCHVDGFRYAVVLKTTLIVAFCSYRLEVLFVRDHVLTWRVVTGSRIISF